MIYLLIVVAAILTLIAVTSQILKNKRIAAVCRMDAIYDKMEFYVAKNQMLVDSRLKSYLRGYKNLVINHELVDIQVLLYAYSRIPKKEMEERISRGREYRSSLPAELNELARQFDENVSKLVSLSKWKPSFIFFLIRLLFLTLLNKTRSSLKELGEVLNNGNDNETFALDVGTAMLQKC